MLRNQIFWLPRKSHLRLQWFGNRYSSLHHGVELSVQLKPSKVIFHDLSGYRVKHLSWHNANASFLRTFAIESFRYFEPQSERWRTDWARSNTFPIWDDMLYGLSWDKLRLSSSLAFHAPLYKARGQQKGFKTWSQHISAAAGTVGDESWGRVYQAISVLSRLCQCREFSSASFPYSFGPPAWWWAHSFGARTRANSAAQEGWTCEMWRLNCTYWPCTTRLARSFHVCTYQPSSSRVWPAVIQQTLTNTTRDRQVATTTMKFAYCAKTFKSVWTWIQHSSSVWNLNKSGVPTNVFTVDVMGLLQEAWPLHATNICCEKAAGTLYRHKLKKQVSKSNCISGERKLASCLWGGCWPTHVTHWSLHLEDWEQRSSFAAWLQTLQVLHPPHIWHCR